MSPIEKRNVRGLGKEMPKTTNRDFKVFKAECEKWIEKYNLNNWEIDITHNETNEGWVASTEFHLTDSRYSKINLEPDWGDNNEVNEKELKTTARHEVRELLLAPLAILYKKSQDGERVSEQEWQTQTHEIIHRLENADKK